VWDKHLGLRWICGQCFHATFQSKRSMARHEKACKVAVQVRCGHCMEVFESQAGMNRHAPECTRLRTPAL
jgi:hypothetical protein